jgi:ABC-type transport system substrate-binding protein
MSRRGPIRFAVALVALTLVVAACQPREAARQGQGGQGSSAGAGTARQAPTSGQQPKRGGTLTMAISKDITVLHPMIRTSSTDNSVRDLAFEPLLAIDNKGNLYPRLAERWQVSPDGKVYTFYLRQGVKFHDGQEMTAEDAKFSMDWTLDAKNAAFGYERLTKVERVEAPERYVLRVYMKAPSAGFLASLTNIQAFSVIPRGSLQEAVEKLTSFPPGTGPFKFVQWEPKQRIVFERFDDYWGEKPYLDRVVFQPIPESTVRITALRAGDVDMVERTPYEWVKEIREGKLPGIGIVDATYAGFRTLNFNVPGQPFENKKLRQAIAHAIDKQEVLHAGYFGFGIPADQKFPKGHTWHVDGLPTIPYDLDKARALLREAGYNGEPIPFVLEQGGEIQAAALAIQAQLRKIGVEVRLEGMDYAAYVARQRRGDFGIIVSGGAFDADPSSTYAPDMRCEPDRTRRGSNNPGYCDPAMDALLDRAEVELDPARRKALFKDVLTKLWDDVPEVYIGFVPRFFTFRDYVKGFTSEDEGRFVHHEGGVTRTWLDK